MKETIGDVIGPGTLGLTGKPPISISIRCRSH